MTSTPIASAVAKAHDRGVKVVAILDKDNKTDKYSAATYLFDHNVSTYIDSKHQIAHNKIMVIDNQTVLTGSFNFTKQAENDNGENLLVMHPPRLGPEVRGQLCRPPQTL